MSQQILKLAWTKLKINWNLPSNPNDELNLTELRHNFTRLNLNFDETNIQSWLNKTDCGYGFYNDDEIVKLINESELEAQQSQSESRDLNKSTQSAAVEQINTDSRIIL
jgi:hypothetical protein